jgi:hypothetical protein
MSAPVNQMKIKAADANEKFIGMSESDPQGPATRSIIQMRCPPKIKRCSDRDIGADVTMESEAASIFIFSVARYTSHLHTPVSALSATRRNEMFPCFLLSVRERPKLQGGGTAIFMIRPESENPKMVH